MKKSVLIIALFTGLLVVAFAYLGVLNQWNLRLTDQLYGGHEPLGAINIIAIDDYSLQNIGRWPWDRSVYIPLLNTTRNARVVGVDIGFFEPSPHDAEFAAFLETTDNVVLASEFEFKHNIHLQPSFNAAQGIVNIYTDKGGISRRVPQQLAGTPSFSRVVAQRFLGTEIVPPQDPYLINFADSAYQVYSAVDVIAGKYSPQVFENSIVLIGATAPDLHDTYFVPTSKNVAMPGVEIHGHAIQTLITQKYLTHQSFNSLAIALLVIALIVGALYVFLPISLAIISSIILFIAYVFIAIMTFRTGVILNLILPTAAILFTNITCSATVALIENKNKKHIQKLFGKYVSKDIVKHLLENEKAVELGGEEREITAMFADIRGFTAMSEKMTPHEVIDMLNHYFGDMTDIIFKHKGTLDKFIGDCLFAVWGSPLEDKDHALHAIECCLEIQKKLKEKRTKKIKPINLGIGMCSGPAVVGNMGSPQRQEFTAIGDTINTASRMAGKAEGGQIVITESTYELVKDKIKVKKLEPVKVKGKQKALQIYLVKGLK